MWSEWGLVFHSLIMKLHEVGRQWLADCNCQSRRSCFVAWHEFHNLRLLNVTWMDRGPRECLFSTWWYNNWTWCVSYHSCSIFYTITRNCICIFWVWFMKAAIWWTYYKLLYKWPKTKLEYTRNIRNINEILRKSSWHECKNVLRTAMCFNKNHWQNARQPTAVNYRSQMYYKLLFRKIEHKECKLPSASAQC